MGRDEEFRPGLADAVPSDGEVTGPKGELLHGAVSALARQNAFEAQWEHSYEIGTNSVFDF
jgi:hypothetical protein